MGRLSYSIRQAMASGSVASIVSTAVLAGCGTRDCRSAYAPVNAVSHWLWRDTAVYQQRATLRYTLAGYVIHHAMSILWAVAYEAWLGKRPRPAWQVCTAGLGVAGAACLVDLKATPQRLTPGFERRLSGPSLAGVYVAFGIGLALMRIVRRH